MLSVLNFWTKTLNLKILNDYNNIYPLNKIKANSMQLESTIIFYIRSISFLKVKKLNSNLVLGDKVLTLLVLFFLIFVFVTSLFLFCF